MLAGGTAGQLPLRSIWRPSATEKNWIGYCFERHHEITLRPKIPVTREVRITISRNSFLTKEVQFTRTNSESRVFQTAFEYVYELLKNRAGRVYFSLVCLAAYARAWRRAPPPSDWGNVNIGIPCRSLRAATLLGWRALA